MFDIELKNMNMSKLFLNQDLKQQTFFTSHRHVEVEVEEHITLTVEETVITENSSHLDTGAYSVTTNAHQSCIKTRRLIDVKTDDQQSVQVYKSDFYPILLPSVNVFKNSLLFQTHVNANRTFCAITPTLIIAIKESKISLHTAKILLYMIIGTTDDEKQNYTVSREKLFELFHKIYETVPGLNKMRFNNYNLIS